MPVFVGLILAATLLLVDSERLPPAVDPPCERLSPASRPETARTPRGAKVSYLYDFPTHTVRLRWGRDTASFGPSPPYGLSGACEPPGFDWENDHFVVLRQSCGSPCWFGIALPLDEETEPTRIGFPLTFDSSRSLIAALGTDGLQVMNLLTKRVQVFGEPEPLCPAVFTGGCVDEASFEPTHLRVRWHTWSADNTDGSVRDIRFELRPEILTQERVKP